MTEILFENIVNGSKAMMVRQVFTFALVSILITLAGCSSKEREYIATVDRAGQVIEQQLETVGKHLQRKSLRNAKLIDQYAKVVKQSSPELSDIVTTLTEEGTSRGALFQSLKSRHKSAMALAKDIPQLEVKQRFQLNEELDGLLFASNANNFNDALADPLNVLADMSKGKLARVDAGSAEDTRSSNGAKNYGQASSLVGNPNYGQWRSHSDGRSFWEFYGQYRLFSDLLSGPVYYGHWSRHRDYSYYSDRGRHHYSSPRQRQASETIRKKTQDRFNARGERFKGPYGKSRSTGQKYASTRGGAANRFKSVSKTPGRLSSSYGGSSGSRLNSAYGSNKSTSNNASKTSYNSRGSYSSSRSFGGGGK